VVVATQCRVVELLVVELLVVELLVVELLVALPALPVLA
jgi:hypothetical protein